ncbi:hypothetical protein D3P08_14185 [Paenibacillus nanensis]|uniref:SLH domain-containing protein n=1 Tax=Paenibacillus nanensis TaxID=393251 RepID=A0A3A1UXH2_9BACL|nr:S-layer homology domain-containing protein [Paenibacillus nanensis]RIX52121.1 hypothetical protein D3P08_14185 [Paenibacillus nanensis]
MKNLIQITCFLLLVSVLLAPAAHAAEGTSLTVAAQVNHAAKEVTITGAISSGAGKQVSVVVTNPSGSVDYIDQTTSGSNGAYTFQYKLDAQERGTYTVTVGGSGVSEPAKITFNYTGGGDISEHPPASGWTNNRTHTHVVDAGSLKPATTNGNPVSVIVPSGKTEVLLPVNAAELLGSSSLRIQSGLMTATIQPSVLAELLQLADDEALDGASISFAFVFGTQAEAEGALPSRRNGTAMSVAGQVVHYDLALTTRGGISHRLKAFSEPIEVVMGYGENADEMLLGIYYHNEEAGKWEYIGGKIDEEHNLIAADLSHFSTYAVLAYEKTFADVPAGYWANPTIRALAARHIITGVTETAFEPRKAVSRAEFTALLTRALGLKESSRVQPFTDIPEGEWYAGHVAAAFEAGMVSGKSADTFDPNADIKREEVAAMLVKAYEYAEGGKTTTAPAPDYADQDEIAAWAEPYVKRAAEAGLMVGAGNNRFAPRAIANRAEAAQAIYNLLTQVEA